MCGGVGVYEFAITLTAAQVASYEHEGTIYIARLADQVRHDEAAFSGQKV